MRVLFAVHGYKPAWRVGGPILSVSSLAEALVRRGHEVIVFTSDSNLDQTLEVPTERAVDVDGVQVWYFKRWLPLRRFLPGVTYVSKSIGFLYSPHMAEVLNRTVPSVDVVHTHLPFNYPTYAAARAAFAHGKPLFYHQRGVFDPERLKFRSLKKTLYLKLVEIPILRRATTLIALTDTEVLTYRRLGVDTPCRVIPNGIDAPKHDSRGPDLLNPLGIQPEHKLILFLGRIHPIKGADRLLDAFKRVQGSFPEALLVLAGPDEFGLESALRKQSEVLLRTRRVIFPGMVTGFLKAQLLARADLFCLPSDAEGFSMAALEAMAAETAVLLSPDCHFPEVESCGAGVISDSAPEALTGALAKLLAARESLKSMGRAGARLVAEHYSVDRTADLTLEAYEEGIQRLRLRNSRSIPTPAS
jgi:glycosyltransferase involved in cell wall biosynthesis